MTRQSDHIVPVKVATRLDPTSTFTGQVDQRQFMSYVDEDGTLADLRVALVQDQVLEDDDGSVFVFDGRIIGRTSESRVKWHSLLKDEEIVLSRMSTSLLHGSKLGRGIIINGDTGPQYAGHAVLADGDSVVSNLLNIQEIRDDIIISYSTSVAEYARAGWSHLAMARVCSTIDDASSAGAHTNVWVTGRHLHSMCQITLPGPYTLRPHQELKAAVEKALEEQDVTKRRQKLDKVWERYGTFYVESVEMGGMYHATRMLHVSQKNTGEAEMRNTLAERFGNDSGSGTQTDEDEKQTATPAEHKSLFSRVGGRKDEVYSRWKASLAHPTYWATTRILQVTPIIELFDEDTQARIALSSSPLVCNDGTHLAAVQTASAIAASDLDPKLTTVSYDDGDGSATPSHLQFAPGCAFAPAADDIKEDKNIAASPLHPSTTELGTCSPGAIHSEPVAALPAATFVDAEVPTNSSTGPTVVEDSVEIVEREIRALLDQLTIQQFDSISDQLIALANRSEKEKDARTFIQVTRLVFEAGTDGTDSSEICARLCRKLMEQISPKVQDQGIKNKDGRPIAGSHLFQKYLLNRCQKEFERGLAPDDSKAAELDILYPDETPRAEKARRRRLGQMRFIGELFKLQMLTARIMHEHVKKLLGDAQNYREEGLESLCQLLTTAGAQLDTRKARAHMDVYFSRLKEFGKSPNVTARVQLVLQDVIELRERKWIAAANNTLRSPPKGGDLSDFDQITTNTSMNIGPSSPSSNFPAGKSEKRESATISRSASANILSANSESVKRGQAPPRPSRKPSTNPGAGGVPNAPIQRRKLSLLPRPVSTDEEREQGFPAPSTATGSGLPMSEASAKTRVEEDCKEFFNVRDLGEAEAYFSRLSAEHRHLLIDKLVTTAIDAKESDVTLVADLFARAAERDWCTTDAFEQGFMPTAEFLDDIVIDVPKAVAHSATMLMAAGLGDERKRRIAEKSPECSTKLLGSLGL